VTAADELLATCWTTAGDAAPSRADQCSPVPLRERIEAAAAAGFTGFGVLAVDLAVAEREHGLSGIGAMLADNGLVHLELEGLPDWWSAGPARARSDELRRFMLTAAEALGARHLKVTPDTSGAPWDAGHWAFEFALLAAQAADAGARLGIEFLPWSNIPTAQEALRLVEDAGHAAGGIVVDVWHVERASTPAAELAELPPHRLVGVELNDADADVVGTLFEDTVDRRRTAARARSTWPAASPRCGPSAGPAPGASRSSPPSTVGSTSAGPPRTQPPPRGDCSRTHLCTGDPRGSAGVARASLTRQLTARA
jgi:sugar phosphate isomerase/epimerase